MRFYERLGVFLSPNKSTTTLRFAFSFVNDHHRRRAFSLCVKFSVDEIKHFVRSKKMK